MMAPAQTVPVMASPARGAGEHESARTLRCASERADPTTREWPAMGAADVAATLT